MRKMQVFACLLFCFLYAVACRPAVGSGWYQSRSIAESLPELEIKEVFFNGQLANLSGGTFSIILPEGQYAVKAEYIKAKIAPKKDQTVMVEVSKNEKGEITKQDFFLAIDNSSTAEKALDAEYIVQPGTSVPITLRVHHSAKQYAVTHCMLMFIVAGGTTRGGAASGNGDTAPPPISNPVDEYGNKKYIVQAQAVTGEYDPFEFYEQEKEKANGFSYKKFENWILNMTDIDSSDIASYRFKEGTWEDKANHKECGGDNIGGSQLNAAWNLRYYRYNSRNARWSGQTVYVPDLDKEKEDRFYFFKFTGTAGPFGSTNLNNSLFCVDRYSKFLFFYSEPGNLSTVAGHWVPSDWQDYAAPPKGSYHVQPYTVPFYETDPVGFVQKNGKVIIYDWVIKNQKDGKYHPAKSKGDKPVAQYNKMKPGRSPYTGRVKVTKYDVKKTINSEYRGIKPNVIYEKNINGMPVYQKDKYGVVNTKEDMSISVKVADMPKEETERVGTEKEGFTYQWYTTGSVAANEGGAKVTSGTGGNTSTFTPDITCTSDAYYYCIITNTYKPQQIGGVHAVTAPNPVRIVIAESEEKLVKNAAVPIILKHPQSRTVPVGMDIPIVLSVKASVSDEGTLSYQWYESSDKNMNSSTLISGATGSEYIISDIASKSVGLVYYYCEIANINEHITGSGKKSVIQYSRVAKIEVEEKYKLQIVVNGQGSFTVLNEGSVVQNGDFVKSGSTLELIALPKAGYKVKTWPEGAVPVIGNAVRATMKVTKETCGKSLIIVFEKIPDSRTLTVTASKICNKTIKWDDNWNSAWFTYLFKAKFENDPYKELWNVSSGVSVFWRSGATQLMPGGSVGHDKPMVLYSETGKPAHGKKFILDTVLSKLHESTAAALGYHKQIAASDEFAVTFTYSSSDDAWKSEKCKENNGKHNVTVKYSECTVKYNESRDFTITYDVEDPHGGEVEVTYRIEWH